MNHAASPQSLESWLELLESRHPTAIDLGLDRCRAVWKRMGSPRPAPSVFVVAGTNGKGSTVATVCALLGALGLRHGSYTTPHLYRYNERIRVLGRPVSDEQLLTAFAQVEAAREGTSLTYFEFGTLAAFRILADALLDHAVMEIGLGGRLDAVNLLDADVAILTAIGLDHQEYLGNDLDSIGREKAGIIRKGRPLICGEASPPASVLAVAAEQGAQMRRLGVDFRLRAAGSKLRFEAAGVELDLSRPALEGAHQLDNLAAGLAAVLERIPAAASDPEALDRGLRSVQVTGRFERIDGGVAGVPAVWIDVGHNPLAARAVQHALAERRSADGIRNCRCVFGMLADKDAAATAAALQPAVSHFYCASLPGERGQTAEQLAESIRGVSAKAPPKCYDSVEHALDAALADSSAGDGILVFGSFLTAAAAGRHWLTKHAASSTGAATTTAARY